MNKYRPNQSGTFNNRVCVHAEDDSKLFVIEHCSDDLRQRREITSLLVSAPELLEALKLILPMAKGYAHTHDVGSNKQYIQSAERALNKALGKEESHA